MNEPTSFGSWLKQRRKVLDLTQADLARCANCSAATIRKIEADERRPSRQIAELLADCLEIAELERPTFLRVARAELRGERLGAISPASSSPEPILKIEELAERTPAAAGPSLPVPPTPLLGREHELTTYDLAFHQQICEWSERAMLLKLWTPLYSQVQRFVVQTHRRYFQDLIEIANTHRPIVEALRGGNVDEAERIIKEHIMLIWSRIEARES